MALMHEVDPAQTSGSLSDESKGLEFGELIRDYEPAPDARWRFGKPDYARVNRAYFKHRAVVHKEGSLEALVSKIVKNWEVESQHVGDVKQWKTMDSQTFRAALNGGPACNAQLMCDTGKCNMLIGDVPDYKASLQTFESASTIWSSAFTQGFAWEVLRVLSGPPTVTFQWRHFGEFTGEYSTHDGRLYKGNGKVVDVVGMCIAKVNDQLIIESLDVYYNPEDLLKPLVTKGMLVVPEKVPEAEDKGGASCSLM